MNWELITSPEFEQAVESCEGVCILPLGVLEKHGDHLPLGQDAIYSHSIATLAAEQEPAMVFPQFYLSQIVEAKMVPGTISLGEELLIPLLTRICDEIARNGFKKIIILNGHGGNNSMLEYFIFTLLDNPKDYMVYLSRGVADKERQEIAEVMTAKVDGHGGEKETSAMLHLYPELVKMEQFADYGLPLQRDAEFEELGLKSAIWWYANHPEHFRADATPPSAAKGEAFVKAHVRTVVKQIKLVTNHNPQAELYQEFLRKTKCPGNNR